MTHKYIMVKMGEAKKRKLCKKRHLKENRGKLIHFSEIGGIHKFVGNRGNMHHWLRGMDAPALTKMLLWLHPRFS